MLYCDVCEQFIDEEDTDITTHVFDEHPEVLSAWAEDHIYEWDGYDAREEALTVGERNPTLK